MSTVDHVQSSLMDAIHRGDLSPGTRLRQDDLAAELGVSKIPVREALQRLAAVGLLQFEQNRGVVVPLLSADDAHEIFSLRRAVEIDLLKAAIVNGIDRSIIAEARALAHDSELSDSEGNWRFHRLIYEVAGWPRGLSIVEILFAAVAPYVKLYLTELGGAAQSDAEHDALLDAIQRGEADRAVEVLEQHLDHAEAALIRSLRDLS